MKSFKEHIYEENSVKPINTAKLFVQDWGDILSAMGSDFRTLIKNWKRKKSSGIIAAERVGWLIRTAQKMNGDSFGSPEPGFIRIVFADTKKLSSFENKIRTKAFQIVSRRRSGTEGVEYIIDVRLNKLSEEFRADEFDDVVNATSVGRVAVTYNRDDKKYGAWGREKEGFNSMTMWYQNESDAVAAEKVAKRMGYTNIRVSNDTKLHSGLKTFKGKWRLDFRKKS